MFTSTLFKKLVGFRLLLTVQIEKVPEHVAYSTISVELLGICRVSNIALFYNINSRNSYNHHVFYELMLFSFLKMRGEKKMSKLGFKNLLQLKY